MSVDPTAGRPDPTAEQEPLGGGDDRDYRGAVRKIATGNVGISFLALLIALVLGGVLIAIADRGVQTAAGYFFARPTDFIGEVWRAVSEAYIALFRGSIYDWRPESVLAQVRPITETLVASVPLILAGLGIAVGFRAGLFNIGAQGQIIVGAIFATYVGFTFDLPVGVHLIFALLGGVLGGALYGGIPGVLKARTGANEVIVTIMLNWIAIYLIGWVLRTGPFNPQNTGQRSPNVSSDAMLPRLIPDWLIEGNTFRLHWGFVIAVLAAVFVWWLMERSTIGFELRAAGANPHAARTAGMSVGTITIITMVIAGALAGLAGATQILGTERSLTAGVAASFGFDAITVALLGRSKPLGVFLAGVLFGALKTGGFLMQSSTATPIDIILVLQAVIVLLIAAPPLVRTIFRLPDPEARRRTRVKKKEVAA